MIYQWVCQAEWHFWAVYLAGCVLAGVIASAMARTNRMGK